MRTLGDWIRLSAGRHPAREAFVGADGRVSFGEARERAARLAKGLRAAGIQPGGTVGVLAGNSVFNAEVFLGVGLTGALYGAYNWRWAAAELAQGIEESKASLVIVEETHEPLLANALDILSAKSDTHKPPRVVRQGEVDALRAGSAEVEDWARPEDGLCLIYTGGSTGFSKAVVISHAAATANAINERMDCMIGALPAERGLMSTPMFHSAGLLTWLVTHFMSGKTTILLEKFNSETFVETVGREKATNTFMIPNMMRGLLQTGAFEDPDVQNSFRALHTGAGLLRMPDKERFCAAMPHARLYFRYGLSEAGPMVTRLLHEDILDPAVDGSIGQEYTFVESRVMSFEDPDQIAKPGELGEIVVRGPSVMSGYYGHPRATAETMRGGWLHTGDLAVRDERGYYFFRDRMKELIKSGGENVYCVEVEQALYLHPAVLEAAVVGVADPTWGEEVRAVVSLREGATATEAELVSFLRQHIAGFKIPKKWAFLEAEKIPRSGAGKLVKARLKDTLGWR